MDNENLSYLDQLRKWTTIVVDSSDFETYRSFGAQDATTNPSLVMHAAQKPEYASLIKGAVAAGKKAASKDYPVEESVIDHVLVSFGSAILEIVPGRVSTEVDARLSFDIEKSKAKAHRLIKLYEDRGISRNRVLIKLASTWEGVQAATQLEKEGIHCNMTLIFNKTQALACAQAGATLVSPFVGRILDWFKKNENFQGDPAQDPGVVSVKDIYTSFQTYRFKTQVMGASFRNIGEILELAGCELLTISPELLGELAKNKGPITRKLSPNGQEQKTCPPISEQQFRWDINESPMATEKLSEGIRNFTKDTRKLEEILKGM